MDARHDTSAADAKTDPTLERLEAMQLACEALLKALQGPDLMGRLQALSHRLANGLATLEDRQLLASLPACQLSPPELVKLFVRVEEDACAHG